LLDHFSESFFDFAEAGQEHRAAGVEDDIPARLQFGAMEAKGFAKTASDAVAVDGAADGSGDGEAEAGALRVRTFASEAKGREQGTGDAETMIIDVSKVGGTEDPAGSRRGQLGASLLWRTGRLFRR